jgi:hypothetical protein
MVLRAFGVAVLSLSLLSLAARAQSTEDLAGLIAALRGPVEGREAAQEQLYGAGLEGARRLAAAEAGDEDFEARRAAIVDVYRARLFAEAALAAGLDKRLYGVLEGEAHILTKTIARARQEVLPRADGGISIKTSISGEYAEFRGKAVAKSQYDANLQLESCEIEASGDDTEKKSSAAIHQVWRRIALDARKARYEVQDMHAGTKQEFVLPREAMMVDLAMMLGRLLRFDSRKIEVLSLKLIDPSGKDPVPAELSSQRREKVVAKGGERVEALRVQVKAGFLPAAFADPKIWLDAAQSPVKARAGALTIYFRARFKAYEGAPLPAPDGGKTPAAPKPEAPEGPAPKSGKREFF